MRVVIRHQGIWLSSILLAAVVATHPASAQTSGYPSGVSVGTAGAYGGLPPGVSLRQGARGGLPPGIRSGRGASGGLPPGVRSNRGATGGYPRGVGSLPGGYGGYPPGVSPGGTGYGGYPAGVRSGYGAYGAVPDNVQILREPPYEGLETCAPNPRGLVGLGRRGLRFSALGALGMLADFNERCR